MKGRIRKNPILKDRAGTQLGRNLASRNLYKHPFRLTKRNVRLMAMSRKNLLAAAVIFTLLALTLVGAVPDRAVSSIEYGPTPAPPPTQGYWGAPANPMPTARQALGAAVVDGKIYAIGGANSTEILGSNEEFDPVTSIWTEKTPMPTPLADFFGTSVFDGKIYCMGGIETSSTQLCWGKRGL